MSAFFVPLRTNAIDLLTPKEFRKIYVENVEESPGGTTITALHEIEKGKLRATLISPLSI